MRVSVRGAEFAYELYGSGRVSLVVEMGLGAMMAEWRPLAKRLMQRHTVLLYQRAGYGDSGVSSQDRTPENIAAELYCLLQEIPHEEKMTLLAHSQGGLYAWVFANQHPDMVSKLVLLDPLSPEDYRFRTELTQEEFRKSGADKSKGLLLNRRLTRLHMGGLVKRMMAGAPPFYYDGSISDEARQEILAALAKPQTYDTAIAEYNLGHDLKVLGDILKNPVKLPVHLTLITHSSEISCQEIRQFGGASSEQAEKIEALWQNIMDFYLCHSDNAEKICAEHSSHYIHLTDGELICRVV